MKKLLILMLALVMMLALLSCGECTEHIDENEDYVCDECGKCIQHVDENNDELCDNCEAAVILETMTYEEFVAADLDSKVCVETYIQAKQGCRFQRIRRNQLLPLHTHHNS